MNTVLKIGDHFFDFSKNVYLMGILNVTPDSFSDGGFYQDPERALDRALQMQEEGADLIDLGGESTRPGAKPVEKEEELRRVLPVIKKIIPRLTIPVSIDTRKAAVAERTLEHGAKLVNDISALSDPDMAKVISHYEVPVILMHMRGQPETMQLNVTYADPIQEIRLFLRRRIDDAFQKGIPQERILIDPGIGFGKRLEDNVAILERLAEFKDLGCPIVFGSSRKSFVRKLYGETPDQVLRGSLETALQAARNGANLLRVHDVAETRRVLNEKLDMRAHSS